MDTTYAGIRAYGNLRILSWLNENEFVGTIEYLRKDISNREDTACYGWSKGAGFMVYKIDEGHIEKLGVIKRAELFDKAGSPVID